MLRFNMAADSKDSDHLSQVLRKNCSAFSLVTIREMQQGKRLDYAYHVKLKKSVSHNQLLAELGYLDSAQQINLMLQEATVDL